MRIYEIEGWAKGAKTRRSAWRESTYIFLNNENNSFVNNNGKAYIEFYYTLTSEDWELYQEPVEELIEKKFYYIFNTLHGYYHDRPYTKDEEYITDGELFKAPVGFMGKGTTNELAYTAYFKKDGDDLKVVKYVLASGEVIEV